MNGRTSLYDKIRPVFDDLVTPEWIEPERNEPLKEYAERVADSLRPLGPIALGGTSFGGIVAREVAGVLGLSRCALISTVRQPSELPPSWASLRPFAQAGEDALIEFAQNPPESAPREIVARWETARAAPGAVSALGRVRGVQLAIERRRTFGSDEAPSRRPRRRFFRSSSLAPDEIVEGGGHVLPISHPDRVTTFLQSYELRA